MFAAFDGCGTACAAVFHKEPEVPCSSEEDLTKDEEIVGRRPVVYKTGVLLFLNKQKPDFHAACYFLLPALQRSKLLYALLRKTFGMAEGASNIYMALTFNFCYPCGLSETNGRKKTILAGIIVMIADLVFTYARSPSNMRIVW